MKTLGFVTIGQSPRDDSVPEMETLLGHGTRVVQAGALDGLTRAEIDALAPRAGDEDGGAAAGDPLITRLRDGASVIVAKQAILGRLQRCLDRLDPEIDAAVLLCTGVFPRFRSSHPVLEPDRILYAGAEAVFDGGRLGVLIPIEAQRGAMAARWRPIDPGVAIAVASPYAGTAPLVAAAEALKRAGASLIAMSCMGYTRAMKALVRDVTGVPALLPTSLVARMAAELVE
jgi:protein AroM